MPGQSALYLALKEQHFCLGTLGLARALTQGMHQTHSEAAKQHELAAQSHRTAAEHNEKGMEQSANGHFQRARECSKRAFELAKDAHNKSGSIGSL